MTGTRRAGNGVDGTRHARRDTISIMGGVESVGRLPSAVFCLFRWTAICASRDRSRVWLVNDNKYLHIRLSLKLKLRLRPLKKSKKKRMCHEADQVPGGLRAIAVGLSGARASKNCNPKKHGKRLRGLRDKPRVLRRSRRLLCRARAGNLPPPRATQDLLRRHAQWHGLDTVVKIIVWVG